MFATAVVLAGLRWRQDWQLFLIACVAFGLGALGWWGAAPPVAPVAGLARRGDGRGSYSALLTGFYVDNGRNCHCGTSYRIGVCG